MGASAAKRAQVAERRAKIIRMKIAGLDNETIAREVGHPTAAQVSGDVTRALMAHKAAEGYEVDSYKALELARLERAQAAIWPKVIQGELPAVDTFIRLSARRCRLLGLDVMQELRVVTSDFLDEEILRLRAEIAMAETTLQEEEPVEA